MDRKSRPYLTLRWSRPSPTVIGVVAGLFAFAVYAHYDARLGAAHSPWAFSWAEMVEAWSMGLLKLLLSVPQLILRPSWHNLDLLWRSLVGALGPSRLIIECVFGIAVAGWSLGLVEEDRGRKAAMTLVICATAAGGVAAYVLRNAGVAASPVAFGAVGALLYTRRRIGVGVGDRLYVSGPMAHLIVFGFSVLLGLAHGLGYLFTMWAAWCIGAWLARLWGDEVSILTQSVETPVPADGLLARVIALLAPQSAWSVAVQTAFVRARDASSYAVQSAAARVRGKAIARFDAWKETLDAQEAAAETSHDRLHCGKCGAATVPTDLFCAACGARTARTAVLRRRLHRKDRRAAATLVGVAAYFALAGVAGFWVSTEQSKEILQTGAEYAADEEVELDSGEVMVAGEWREKVEHEPYLVVMVYGIIVGLFLALALWARWSPFAALVVGTGLFASLVVLEIVLAPEAWHHGLYLRIVIAVSLGVAIRTARSELRHTVGVQPASERLGAR